MIGLIKYNHKKNLQTDRQSRREAGPAHAMSYYSCPDEPTRRVLRARRYATKGRIGLGLHRTTRAALRSIGSSRDFIKGPSGASCGQGLV
jgi:hypothetical protein